MEGTERRRAARRYALHYLTDFTCKHCCVGLVFCRCDDVALVFFDSVSQCGSLNEPGTDPDESPQLHPDRGAADDSSPASTSTRELGVTLQSTEYNIVCRPEGDSSVKLSK